MKRYICKGISCYCKKWVFGYLISSKEIEGEDRIYSLDDKETYTIFPGTLCQCTELKDKNENYIFEHDLVHACDEYTGINFYGEVLFKYGSFAIRSGKDICRWHYRWMDYDVEVNGNRFDSLIMDNEFLDNELYNDDDDFLV